jgi:hypothetical protein
MKKICIIILTASALCACKPADHRDAPAAQTTVPITGAFGWTLGQKVPPEFELFQGWGWSDDNNHSNEPFSNIQGSCLLDRTVYEIIGIADRSQASVIMGALETKYGPGGFGYTTNGEFETWVNGDCQVRTERFNNIVTVTYKNMALEAKHSDEMSDRRNAASAKLSGHL